MSRVTDNERTSRGPFNSRNTVTDDKGRGPASLSSRNVACEICGRTLADGELVYNHQCGKWGWLRPTCEACALKKLRSEDFTPASPCEFCGSPVRYQRFGYRGRLTFCSVLCRSRDTNRRYRAARAASRVKVCGCCGLTFTATRNDAKFCGAACKQAIHRNRKREVSP